MLYSTTRGTSGDIDSDTWLDKHEALVNMFKYLENIHFPNLLNLLE